MRSTAQTQSLHYVQIYAVKSPIDFSPFSLTPKSSNINESSLYELLPSEDDYRALKKNFSVLVAKTLHEHLPFFGSDFKGLIPQHTPHQYSNEMSTKSEVVSEKGYLTTVIKIDSSLH